jgi:ankyrin repeat protein
MVGRQNHLSPVHLAAFNSRVEVAKQLMEAKADVNARDKVSAHKRNRLVRTGWQNKYSSEYGTLITDHAKVC